MHGARARDTNVNGDIRRRAINAWINDGHWFTQTEASKALGINFYTLRRYIEEYKRKGFLDQRLRERQAGISGRASYEFRLKDMWHMVVESEYPLVQHYYMRMRKLADIYRTGNVPTEDSIDGLMTDIGDDINALIAQVDLLSMVYDNPDMRKAVTFVKRMGITDAS